LVGAYNLYFYWRRRESAPSSFPKPPSFCPLSLERDCGQQRAYRRESRMGIAPLQAELFEPQLAASSVAPGTPILERVLKDAGDP